VHAKSNRCLTLSVIQTVNSLWTIVGQNSNGFGTLLRETFLTDPQDTESVRLELVMLIYVQAQAPVGSFGAAVLRE
jgi:hypothetical protein